MNALASACAMGAVSAIISISLIGIAVLLASAVLWIVCRGTVCSSLPASPHAGADDPFFFPVGDAPTLPPDWQRERAIHNYRRALDPSDFRTCPSACLPSRRNEDGSLSASRSSTAAILTFPGGRRA